MFWIGPLILIATFFFMEFVAWCTHKFLMHGIMWYFHKDHHQIEPGFFERNDVFFLIFAIPSWLFIMLGMMSKNYVLVWIGFGIACYGASYFLVHDVFVHQRVKWLRGARLRYFKAMRQTHHLHHAVHTKEGAEAFGFLFVPKRYLTKYGRD